MRGANHPSTVKLEERSRAAPTASCLRQPPVCAPCSEPALPSGRVTVAFGGFPVNAAAALAPMRHSRNDDMPSKPLVRGESPTASRPSTPPASVTPSGQYATVRGVEGTLVPVPPA